MVHEEQWAGHDAMTWNAVAVWDCKTAEALTALGLDPDVLNLPAATGQRLCDEWEVGRLTMEELRSDLPAARARQEAADAHQTVLGCIRRPPEWDFYEAYFLAGWPCEQGLRTVIPGLPREPMLVDLGAGSGVFGQRARLINPHAQVVGVEVRTDERAAARHYDRWIERDVFAVENELRDLRPHLVMANPAFSKTVQKLALALRVVRPGGYVLFLVRADWGQSEDAWDFLYRCPPLMQLVIGGRPQFLKGKKANGEEYGTDWSGAKWLLWKRGARGVLGQWLTRQLPRLPGASMEWILRPGTELHSSPLPPYFWPDCAIGGHP